MMFNTPTTIIPIPSAHLIRSGQTSTKIPTIIMTIPGNHVLIACYLLDIVLGTKSTLALYISYIIHHVSIPKILACGMWLQYWEGWRYSSVNQVALTCITLGLLRPSEKVYCYLLPILNILVPHTGHVPWVAGLPFFMVILLGSFISLLVRHFMQYACIRFTSLLLENRLWPTGMSIDSLNYTIWRSVQP